MRYFAILKKEKYYFYLLLSVFSISCRDKTERIRPRVENISESVYGSGKVKSANQYEVFSVVNGVIKDVLVSEGDSVLKGSPLFLITNEVSKLNTENAKLAADFAAYQSNLNKLEELKLKLSLASEKMKSDSVLFERQKKLWNEAIGSKFEYEQRELLYLNSRGVYESAILNYNDTKRQIIFSSKQALNNLKISKEREDDFIIKSEIKGKVFSLLKEKGEMVNVQMPVAVLGDDSMYFIELQIDEYDIVRIKLGQRIFVALDSYKGMVYEAKVVKIYSLMNERTKTFQIDADFVHRPPVLYPNLTLEANIIINTKKDVLTIPRSYLMEDQYVIGSDGERIKVETGLKDFEKIEVISGITNNTELIKFDK